MTEIGRIIKTEKGIATVRFARKGECDKCLICSVAKDGAHVDLDVDNSLDLNVGDYVKVEVYDKRVRRASVLIYLIPLILVALGAGLGSLASAAAAIIIGILGLVAGLAFSLPIDICVIRRKSGAKPRMTESATEDSYLVAVRKMKENARQE